MTGSDNRSIERLAAVNNAFLNRVADNTLCFHANDFTAS